jgi:Cu/Ag efflux protein CusF
LSIKLFSFFHVALAFMPTHLLFLSFALLTSVFSMAAYQSAAEKHYPLQAEVIAVDAPRRLIVVKHGEISGFMPAMTMSYAVLHSKDIKPLHAGDKISAELVVADNKGHLEKIALVSKAATKNTLAPAN